MSLSTSGFVSGGDLDGSLFFWVKLSVFAPWGEGCS